MKLKNVSKGALGLAKELVIEAGDEIEIEAKKLDSLMTPVIQGWFDDGKLVKLASKPGPKPKQSDDQDAG
jgi:ABC-type ATPase with predicted acetyltransferase domain